MDHNFPPSHTAPAGTQVVGEVNAFPQSNIYVLQNPSMLSAFDNASPQNPSLLPALDYAISQNPSMLPVFDNAIHQNPSLLPAFDNVTPENPDLVSSFFDNAIPENPSLVSSFFDNAIPENPSLVSSFFDNAIPENPSLVSSLFESDIPQYNLLDILPPLPLNSSSVTAPPNANTFASSSFAESNLMNQQTNLPLQDGFMVAPDEFSNLSSTGLNAEDPNLQGTLWSIPGVGSQHESSSYFQFESEQYSIPYVQQENQLLDSSSYIGPYYDTSFNQLSVYSSQQWQQQMPINSAPNVTSGDMVIDSRMSIALPPNRGKEYKCSLCAAKFPSPQAFGGHMSAHSKAAKKDGSSSSNK